MFRSLSTAKIFTSLINRRGFATASQGGVSARFGEAGSRTQDAGKVEDNDAKIKEEEESGTSPPCWTPDPVTGHYKPCDGKVPEISPAELREMFLNRSKINTKQN